MDLIKLFLPSSCGAPGLPSGSVSCWGKWSSDATQEKIQIGSINIGLRMKYILQNQFYRWIRYIDELDTWIRYINDKVPLNNYKNSFLYHITWKLMNVPVTSQLKQCNFCLAGPNGSASTMVLSLASCEPTIWAFCHWRYETGYFNGPAITEYPRQDASILFGGVPGVIWGITDGILQHA